MGIDCLCIGGAAVDRSFRLVGPAVLGTSNIASSDSGLGGVARNVAESLARLGARTALLTAVGADPAGWELVERLTAIGVDAGLVQVVPGGTTAEYVAVLDPDGEVEVRNVIGGLPLPAGCTRAAGVSVGADSLTVTDESGASLTVPYDASFLARGR